MKEITIKEIKLVRKLSESRNLTIYKGQLKKSDKAVRIVFFKKRDRRIVPYFINLTSAISKEKGFATATRFGITEEDVPFLIFPLGREKSLRNMIDKGEIDANLIIRIGLELLHKLRYLHEQNIFAVRLIPENVWINTSFNVRLFAYNNFVKKDISGFVGGEKIQSEIFYLAPEMIKNLYFEKANDFYMLGIMMYEMISRNVPFYDQNSVEVLKQHLDAQPPVLDEFPSELHRQIYQIILPLMEKDPVLRLRSVEVVTRMLGSLSQNSGSRWDVPYWERQRVNHSLDAIFEDVKNKLVANAGKINFGKGHCDVVSGKPGTGKNILVDIFVSACKSEKINVLSIPVWNGTYMQWQGMIELLERLDQYFDLENEYFSGHYGDLLRRVLFKMDTESVQVKNMSTINALNIKEAIIDLLKNIALNSPFVIVAERFDRWDQKSKDVLMDLVRIVDEIPLYLLLTSDSDIQVPPGHLITLQGLMRSRILKYIQEELEVDTGSALRVYNQIIAKSGNLPLRIESYLNWWQKYRKENEPVPLTPIGIFHSIVLNLDEAQKKFITALSKRLKPLKISLLNSEEKKTCSILEEMNLLKTYSFGRGKYVFFRDSLFQQFWDTRQNDGKKVDIANSQWDDKALPQTPWDWFAFLSGISDQLQPDVEKFLVMINYYNSIGGVQESIRLLELFEQKKPEISLDARFLWQYYNCYLQLGSYETALLYLKKIITLSEDIDKKRKVRYDFRLLDLKLETISLMIKMDRFQEAEKLIENLQENGELSTEADADVSYFAGIIFANSGNRERAFAFLKEAQSKYQKSQDWLRLLSVNERVITFYLENADLQSAWELIIHSIEVASRINNKPHLQTFLKYKGDLLFQNNQIVEAAETFQSALEIFEYGEGSEKFSRILMSKGKLQWLVGDYRNAIEYFNKAQELQINKNDIDLKIEARGNIASIFREMGNLGEALSLETEIHEFTEENNLLGLKLISMNNLGYIYMDINRHQKARELFLKAIELAKKYGSAKEKYRSLLGLVSLYLSGKFVFEAKNQLKNAISVSQQEEDFQMLHETIFFEASLAKLEGDPEMAELKVKRFIKKTKVSFRFQTMGKLLLGELYLLRKNYKAGLKILGEAFNLSRLAGLDPLLCKILYVKSQIHHEMDDEQAANSALDQSIMVLYKIADSIDNEIDRMIFLESIEFSEIWESAKNRKSVT